MVTLNHQLAALEIPDGGQVVGTGTEGCAFCRHHLAHLPDDAAVQSRRVVRVGSGVHARADGDIHVNRGNVVEVSGNGIVGAGWGSGGVAGVGADTVETVGGCVYLKRVTAVVDVRVVDEWPTYLG